MDLIQQPNRQQQIDLARELGGLKLYSQISVMDQKFLQAVDVIL